MSKIRCWPVVRGGVCLSLSPFMGAPLLSSNRGLMLLLPHKCPISAQLRGGLGLQPLPSTEPFPNLGKQQQNMEALGKHRNPFPVSFQLSTCRWGLTVYSLNKCPLEGVLGPHCKQLMETCGCRGGVSLGRKEDVEVFGDPGRSAERVKDGTVSGL